jgi:hypothetical protein
VGQYRRGDGEMVDVRGETPRAALALFDALSELLAGVGELCVPGGVMRCSEKKTYAMPTRAFSARNKNGLPEGKPLN